MMQIFKKIDLFLKTLLILIILLVFLPQIKNVFNIPIDKPYFTGEWDEPFAINAGINVLRTKGNPVFYNYGGTCIYPHALIFHMYCKSKGISPYYASMDKKFHWPHWPVFRKIYPVKPIYIAKVIAYLIFLSGSFLYVVLFSLLLLPVPFWLIPSINNSGLLEHYASQMLPETHLGLLAGLASIFFIKALIEKDIRKYFGFIIACAIFASLTVAAKINAAYILLLPLSLLWRLIKEKHLNWKKIILIVGAFAIPYILINPAVVLNTKGYYRWVMEMFQLSGAAPKSWMNRTSEIFPFINDLYFLNIFPNWLLTGLFILTCILLIRIDPVAFFGFMFFYVFSVQNIANMQHTLWGRHFIFLILPFNLFVLFPFIYFYGKMPVSIKTGMLFLGIAITLFIFPLGNTINGIKDIYRKSFGNQWTRESRDELIDFVKLNSARIYFYDYHGFSLPNNINDSLILFSDISAVPEKLGQNEYVGLILYAESNHEKYRSDKEFLLKKYKMVRIFGNVNGAHDINAEGPSENPTILILK